MVPRREFELLAEPARQPEMLEAYLRQRPHEDIVIEFTGSTMGDLAIAIIAGFNWLNHCAVLAAADRPVGGQRHVDPLRQRERDVGGPSRRHRAAQDVDKAGNRSPESNRIVEPGR